MSSSAAQSDAPLRGALLIRIHGQLCVLPMSSVAEVMRPLHVDPVAGQPPAMLGVTLLRGTPTPVVDAGRLVGGAPGNPTRFVSLRVRQRAVVLAVDAVLGVRDLSEATLHELPSLLQGAAQNALEQLGQLDDELLLMLRSARFVEDDVWQPVAR